MAIWEYACMKTTLDIPADLYRSAKIKAAMEGCTLKEIVARGLVLALHEGKPQESAGVMTAFDSMKDAYGCVESGVSDLGSNPDHLKGFGSEK
jgi:hypothetical protein